jgi:hypothetical protein
LEYDDFSFPLSNQEPKNKKDKVWIEINVLKTKGTKKNKLESMRIKLNFFANFEIDIYFTCFFHRGPSSINFALFKQIKAN